MSAWGAKPTSAVTSSRSSPQVLIRSRPKRPDPRSGDLEYFVMGVYSGLAPEVLTTLQHFSVSLEMSMPNSAGEPLSGTPPSSEIRACSFGLARLALISLLSLSMMGTGVFFGAPTPYQIAS